MSISIDHTTNTLTPSAGTLRLGAGLQDKVYTLTGTAVTLSAASGGVQQITLTGSTALSDGLVSGESLLLCITGSGAYTVTWPTITWKHSGAASPSLPSGTVVQVVVWKVGTVLYGMRVGT